MDSPQPNYLILIVVSIAITAGVGFYAYRRRKFVGASAFVAFTIVELIWMALELAQRADPALGESPIWDNIDLAVAFMMPLFWLWFCLEITDHGETIQRRAILVLLPVVGIALAILFVDSLYHVSYSEVTPEHTSSVHAPLTWGITAYSLVVLGGCYYLLGGQFARRRGIFRAQFGIILLGISIPALEALAYTIFGIGLIEGERFSTFGLAICSLIIAWGLFRYQLFDIVPVARDLIMEKMRDAVVVLDLEKRIIDVNRAALKLADPQVADPIGKPLREVFPDWTDIDPDTTDSLTFLAEFVINRNGQPVHYERRLSPIRDRREQLAGWLLNIRDVTRQAQLREELRRKVQELEAAQRKYTELVNNIPGVVFVAGQRADGTPFYDYISPNCKEVNGIAPEEVYKDPYALRRLIAPEYLAHALEGLAESARTLAPYHSQLPKIINGEMRWFDYHATPQRLDDGSTVWHGIELEITDRKRAEEALRQSEANHRALLNAIPDVMFRVSRDGTYLDYHAPSGSILLVPPEAFLGKRVTDVMPPDLAELVMQHMEHVLASGQADTFDYTLTVEGQTQHYEARMVATGPDEVIVIARNFTDQVGILETVQDREERLRAILTSLDDLVFTIDRHRRYEEFHQLPTVPDLAMPPDQFVGKSIYEIGLPDALVSQLSAAIDRLETDDEVQSIDYQLTTARGPQWFNARISRRVDPQGQFVGVTYVSRNIMQRKQMEEELRLSRRALEASTLGIAIIDAQQPGNTAIYVNPAFEKITGYSREEILRTESGFLLGVDVEQPGIEAVRQALREQRECLVTLRTYRKDGAVFWGEVLLAPIFDNDDKATHFVVVLNDITKRILAEAAAREGEQRYRMLLEMLPLGVVVIQQEDVAYANSAAQGLAGGPNLERALLDLDLVQPGQRSYVIERLNYVRETGRIAKPTEITLRRPDGSEVEVEFSAIPFPYQGKNAILAVVTDISDRRLAERQKIELMVERERRSILEEFIQDASHDLRTPIAGLLSARYVIDKLVKMLRGQVKHLEPVDGQKLAKLDELAALIGERISSVGDTVERLHRLVEAMLEMARLDGQVNLELLPSDLNASLERLIAPLRREIEQKSLRLTLDLEGDMPLTLVDRAEFGHAVANLIRNAIQFTPPGGEIQVRTFIENGQAIVAVRDTGPGIDEKDLPHIFKRFYRADRARSTESGGNGLGLSIAQRIIELHGGRIEVESAPGSGSTFRIVLPTAFGTVMKAL